MVSYVDEVRECLAKELLGLEEPLLDLYALLVLARGVNTTEKDVHDAWAIWRSRTDPKHPSVVPFGELWTDVQVLDAPYADAIVRVAERLWNDQWLNPRTGGAE
jgi:hypothetical protein